MRFAAVGAAAALAAYLAWTASTGGYSAIRLIPTRPPAGGTPARGPTNLVFVSRHVGFLATTGGTRFVPRAGSQLPTAPGEIERTDDGGATWRTLWRGRLTFESLAVKGNVVVAEGVKLPETGAIYRAHGGTPTGPRVLLVSENDGRTWSQRRGPPAGSDLELLKSRAWVVFSAYEEFQQPASLLRSDDAGLHWRRLSVPAGTQLVRFATPSVGLASAHAGSCSGPHPIDDPFMQLWRTTDGGVTWRAVPGTCAAASSEADIDVVSPRLVFAAQSGSDLDGPSVVRRSMDSGRTWTTIFREPKRGVFKVAFSNVRSGFVLEDEWHGRYSGYFGYELLASTGDGGHTWTRHGVPADLPIAYYGHDVWIGHDLSSVIWHTADGGASWRLTTASRYLDPGGPDLIETHDPLLVGSRTLVIASGAGPVTSHDGGRTWTPARWPMNRQVAIADGTNAWIVEAETVDKFSARVVTPDGSSALRLPRGFMYLASVAFTTRRNGAIASDQGIDPHAVYVTHNGGQSWRVVPPPDELEYFRPILGPGVIGFVGDRRVFVSVDEGRSWRPLRLVRRGKPFFECTVVRPLTRAIWITCTDLFGSRTVIFRSGDGGRTWTRRAARRLYLVGFLPTGASEAWATTQRDSYTGASTTALWHTTDGGETWHQVWVALKPEVRALQIDCAISMSGVIHARYARCNTS